MHNKRQKQGKLAIFPSLETGIVKMVNKIQVAGSSERPTVTMMNYLISWISFLFFQMGMLSILNDRNGNFYMFGKWHARLLYTHMHSIINTN